MFIQKLWDKNPEFVKQQLMLILFCRDDMDKFFYIHSVEEDRLVFKNVGPAGSYMYDIYVDDFKIYDEFGKAVLSPQIVCREWRQFMARMYGVKYLEALYKEREREKQELIAKFNADTDKIINNLSEYAEQYEKSL
jgi:hypothetical protein